MNKKVLIDKQALIDELMKIPGVGSNSDALETIKRFPLYEPQKPVVPKFVAEWFEKNKNDLHDKLFCEIATVGNVNEKTEFQHWLFNTPNCMNIVLNMKNGYEVEKEPLYTVELPSITSSKLVYDEDYCKYRIVGDYTVGYLRHHLTEKEIKAFDERYWAFAVPVEEVAEG
ncbi:TPA: DUF1642 domain-containing protein [Enterococcus faecium]